MSNLRPFHLAFPVYNIDTAIKWYVDILNCSIGRQSRLWVDFDFFGHQISAHLTNKNNGDLRTNHVDKKDIPSGSLQRQIYDSAESARAATSGVRPSPAQAARARPSR